MTKHVQKGGRVKVLPQHVRNLAAKSRLVVNTRVYTKTGFQILVLGFRKNLKLIIRIDIDKFTCIVVVVVVVVFAI
jgi:hypothetical protein